MHGLVDAVDEPAGFDLMRAVAGPLPVIVIAEMLGVPPEDRERFRQWSSARARILEPLIGAQERARGVAAGEAFDAYFLPIIRARRREPRDDIISALAQAQEEGDSLSEREMLTMLRLLLVAGNETTTNLIGNGMLALLEQPEQLRLLREDPSRIQAAVEELLRFDTPVRQWSSCRASSSSSTLIGCAARRAPTARGVAAGEAFDAYFLPIIRARRRDPGRPGGWGAAFVAAIEAAHRADAQDFEAVEQASKRPRAEACRSSKATRDQRAARC